MTRHTCRELGLCQVEARALFDLPTVRPCAGCLHTAAPVVVQHQDGSREVFDASIEYEQLTARLQERKRETEARFPFAPGVIDGFDAPARRQRAMVIVACVSAAVGFSIALGLLAGYMRGKGWL